MKKIFIFILFLITPASLNAQIIINEIMYDFSEGSDSGREWIELYNNSNEEVNIDDWRLFEANTNHKLNLINENDNFLIAPKEFFIIVDKIEKFNIDYPNFSGAIFDSAFSLSNTGETLIIKDSDLNEIDSMSYSSDLGANGDGNSLQIINNSFVPAKPTLGFSNESNQDVITKELTTIEEVVVVETSEGYLMNKNIYLEAGVNRDVVVGAETLFTAKALGIEREPLKNARYVWNFGDGSKGEGEKVLHNYFYPGTYIVLLNVSSGGYSAVDRFTIRAQPADIIISSVDKNQNFVEIYNKSSFELNLSWWKIRAGKNIFTFPKDTIILASSKIKLPREITKLDILDITNVFLLYPNEKIVNHYNPINNLSIKYKEPKPVSKIETEYIEVSSQTKESLETDDYLATVVGSDSANKVATDQNSIFNKWTFSLVGLMLVSISGVLLVRRNEDDFLDKRDIDEEDLSSNEDVDEDNNLKPEDFKIID